LLVFTHVEHEAFIRFYTHYMLQRIVCYFKFSDMPRKPFWEDTERFYERWRYKTFIC